MRQVIGAVEAGGDNVVVVILQGVVVVVVVARLLVEVGPARGGVELIATPVFSTLRLQKKKLFVFRT